MTAPVIAVAVALSRRTPLADKLKLVAPTVGLTLLYLAFRIWWLGGIGGYELGRGRPSPLGPYFVWLPVNARNLLQLLGSPVSHKVAGALPLTWGLGFLWLIPWLGLGCPRSWRLPLAVGLGTFLVTYLPVVSIPLSTHGVTWRFLYLPSTGLALAAAWVGSQLPWRRGIFAATVMAWLLVLHANLILWESSSWYTKRVGEELQRREATGAPLGIVVPASFAGAYMHPALVGWVGVVYRPGARVVGFTERQASRVAQESVSLMIFPRPLLCFPAVGKPYCPHALPTYWEHPGWKASGIPLAASVPTEIGGENCLHGQGRGVPKANARTDHRCGRRER